MKVALYGRVSTRDKGQDTENQLRQLREYSKRMEYSIASEFVDNVSGSGKVARPKFEEMMIAAYQKQFDLVLFWSLDRFSREGVQITFNHLQRLNDYKVKWKSYTEPFLDSSGPMGEAIIAIFACIAKQERVRLSERVKAGLEKVRLQGSRSGKSIGGQWKTFRRDKAIELWMEGKTIRVIAREMGESTSTIYRAVKSVSRTSLLTLPLELTKHGVILPLETCSMNTCL